MNEVVFDKKSYEYKPHNDEWNRIFATLTQNYLNDLLRIRGYLYANQIYESLGIQWNPENENTLCTDKIIIKVKEADA